jgi:hypothetical protein
MPPRPRRAPAVIDAEPFEPKAPKWDFDLDELDAQIAESIGSAPVATIKLPTGDVISLRPMTLMSDERVAEVARVQQGEDLDTAENADLRSELAQILDTDTLDRVWELVEPQVRQLQPTIGGKRAEMMSVRLARAILGAEDYDRFVAGGGNSLRVVHVFNLLNEGMSDDDPKSSKS